MKKIATLALTLGLLATLPSCSVEVDTSEVSIILPNGTPALAMGTLLNEVDSEVVTDATLLQAALVSTQDKYDLVIAPLTAGTNLYLKGKSNYKLEAVITTNNAYLVSRGENALTSDALQGKEITGFQETNTPGIILKTYIEKFDINATTNFVGNVNQSVTAFINEQVSYAVVAEPQLTKLEAQYTDLNVLNLGAEICEEGSFVPQAALFVNPDVKDDEDVKAFLDKLEQNINKLNSYSSTYAEELVNSGISYFSTYTKEVLTTALPRCNLAYKKGSENKESIEKFYDSCDLYVNNMFGGKKPDEEFYN